ncbi:MAG: hypothetical protein GY841_01565 [FCB group bacterium]|nr:hypothetical protein [FCB group bacterium]
MRKLWFYQNIVVVLFLFCGQLAASNYGITVFDQPYQSKTDQPLVTNCLHLPLELVQVTDTVSDNIAGSIADHQIGFKLPVSECYPFGLLRGRQVVITLPPEFDVTTITSVSYRDTDEDDDPEISWIYVYSESIVIRFSDALTGPRDLFYVYITLHGITNSTTAGDFRAVVSVDNFFGQTLAGPNHSDYFSIVPDEPVSLRVIPDQDLFLSAGEGVAFTAVGVDRFGNPTSNADVIWSISDELDPIGVLYDSFLQATTVGVGRVKAQGGNLTAESGLISVSPGSAAMITISQDEQSAVAGNGLDKDIEVEITDQFGNRASDYTGAVWFDTDDHQAEVLHDDENPYQFTPEDQGRKVFSGQQFVLKTAGQQELTVTDGGFSAVNDNIYIYPSWLAEFDLESPDTVRAGIPFYITVENGRDNYGNPVDDSLFVSGGRVAPDGTYALLQDIILIDGFGSGQAVLVAAGIDTLMVTGSLKVLTELEIKVQPGPAAQYELDLDETQFLGNPFRGIAGLTVFDKFRNLKSDYNETGDVLIIDDGINGQIIPGEIAPDQFINGMADLSTYTYDGDPGPVLVRVGTIDDIEVASRTIYFNGIAAVFDDRGEIPLNVPANWMFSARGALGNPGNQTPETVNYYAGFVSPEVNGSVIIARNCILDAFSVGGCYFAIEQEATVSPGENYEYEFVIEATYDIDGNSFIARWKYESQITVIPFEELSFDALQLPEIGFAVDYESPIPSLIGVTNPNIIDIPGNLKIGLYICEQDDCKREFYFGSNSVSFGHWPSYLELPILNQFHSDLLLTTYGITARVTLYSYTPENRYLAYRRDLHLDQAVDIVPRAIYGVDPVSVHPKQVPAGAEVPLSFNLDLTGLASVELNGPATTLTLTAAGISSMARLAEDVYDLSDGANLLTTMPLSFPESWIGEPITAQLHLVGEEAGVLAVDAVLDFDLDLIVEDMPALQVMSLEMDAPNAPFVNIGQSFGLIARIVNRSSAEIAGPIAVFFTSDGNTIPNDGALLSMMQNIGPYDTVLINPTVTADSIPNPAELFSVAISPAMDIEILPPMDDKAVAVIVEPPQVQITPQVIGIPGAIPHIDFGEKFEIVASFADLDMSKIEGGTVILNYSGSDDFGLEFPSEKPLEALVLWQLTAPSYEIVSEFTVSWGEKPVDRNTGDPIETPGEPMTIAFMVRAAVIKLLVQADSFDTKPLQRGVTSHLLTLSLDNITNDSRADIGLRSIRMQTIDRDGNVLDAGKTISAPGTNFFINGTVVSSSVLINGDLVFSFDEQVIFPGERLNLQLYLTTLPEASLEYFNLRLEGDMIKAEILGGPRIGQAAPVFGLFDRVFDISLPQAIIAENLGESFKNYPNPFNPDDAATEFKYFLPSASDVNIHIYTATGEKVRHMHFDAESNGGRAGPNDQVFWDGRNGSGEIVLNGVYIAIIEVAAGDLKAKIKMAVVK